MNSVYPKLAKVKAVLNPIRKTETNPFLKSKYFDINSLLEQVEPILQEHGLILAQPIQQGKVTTYLIDPDTGDDLGSEIELPQMQDPQKLGSAITYYRRYTLVSLLALQSLDDDGEIVREDLEKLRQVAYNLLETSIWNDREVIEQARGRIASQGYEGLKNAIKELKENQREPMRMGAKEVNEAVADRIAREK
jgi:hypothetical protein